MVDHQPADERHDEASVLDLQPSKRLKVPQMSGAAKSILLRR